MGYSFLPSGGAVGFSIGRLCYVFETDKDGKIVDIAIGGENNSVFVSGFEVEDNDVFYDIMRPFLTEDAAKDLEIYLNRN